MSTRWVMILHPYPNCSKLGIFPRCYARKWFLSMVWAWRVDSWDGIHAQGFLWLHDRIWYCYYFCSDMHPLERFEFSLVEWLNGNSVSEAASRRLNCFESTILTTEPRFGIQQFKDFSLLPFLPRTAVILIAVKLQQLNPGGGLHPCLYSSMSLGTYQSAFPCFSSLRPSLICKLSVLHSERVVVQNKHGTGSLSEISSQRCVTNGPENAIFEKLFCVLAVLVNSCDRMDTCWWNVFFFSVGEFHPTHPSSFHERSPASPFRTI